jgi:hypothetical protein
MPLQGYKRGLQYKDPSPYYNPEQNRIEAMQRMQGANESALGGDFTPNVLPQYDWGLKAVQAGSKAAQVTAASGLNQVKNALLQQQANAQAAQQAAQQQYNQAMQNAQQGNNNPRLRAVLRALGQQESGGNWSAINATSGALGKWQVMPSNISGTRSGWDWDALQRDVSTSEYLNNPAIQRAIVRNKFGGYLNKYGLRGALSSWYSGSPTRWNERTPQGGYPSVHDYVLQVLERLGL